MLPYGIPKEAKDYIIANCSKTGEELRLELKEKYGVDISVQGVLEHVKKARKTSEEITRCADAHIAQNIASRIEKFLPTIIDFYESDLVHLTEIIKGYDEKFDMIDNRDDSKTKMDKFWQEKYRQLFIKESESYLKLRPPIQTVKIESSVDPDIACMESWSDEKISEYEKFLKKLESME